jgi:hypothetical protein
MNEIFYIDNFYENPKEIIEKYGECDQYSPCPGSRSLKLDQIDRQFYNWFKEKIYNIHGLEDRPDWYLTTYFNLIPYFDEGVLNYNWPHIDGDVRYDNTLNRNNYYDKMILGGQIILCDIVDENLAARFWNPKPHLSEEEIFDRVLYGYIVNRDKYEKNEITLEEYINRFDEFHKDFMFDKKIDNVFNRMISWKAGSIRGGLMVSKKQQWKLSQNFYVHAK